jgi:phosphotransferase system HPr-like phosphotransfer protein
MENDGIGTSPATPVDEAYDALKQYLLLRFQKPYTATKIMALLASAVKFLAHVKSVDGPKKKDLALRAIRDVIAQLDLDDNTKAELISVVDTFGDGVIEELVNLGKDMVTFAKAKCKGKCCFK